MVIRKSVASWHSTFTHPHPASPADAVDPFSRKPVVVMAWLKKDDVRWASKEFPGFELAIYSVDNDRSKSLSTPLNKDNEAMGYLTYIIDNYHFLPNISIFVNFHRDGYPQAWHTDAPENSNVYSITHLRQEVVMSRGYVNLRCNGVPGCSSPEIQINREPKDPLRTAENTFPAAWRDLMGPDIPCPTEIAAPCCSQFAASSDQIHKHPRSDYERCRQWLIDTELDDATSGRVFEYQWHIMFGREPVDCPEYYSCIESIYRPDVSWF